jgi:branched-chain amino acid transport system permease protein
MPNRPLATDYLDERRLLLGRWERRGLLLLGLAIVLFPAFASNYWITIANLTMVAIVGSVGLMVLTGLTGQISLGHAAFLAVGAYTAAVLGSQWQVPFWLLIPLSGLLAAAVGLAVGPFALRLEGLYLAIVTVGLIFLVNHVLLSFPDLTGGVSGIAVPIYSWFGDDGTSALTSFTEPLFIGQFKITFEIKLYGMFILLTLASVLGIRNLVRSNIGRAMMAVRDHDLAAAVMGVNPARTKIIAFGLSSFIAGIAGAMFAFQQQYLTVEPPFNMLMSVQYIAMIVLGGIGTVFGAVAGPIAFVVLSPIMEMLARHLPYISELNSSQQSTLLFALLVIGFMIFEPLGLYGIWLRIKRYFMAWPFSY